MNHRFDSKTFVLLLGATLLGAAWATYNYLSTGGQRGESEITALVWTIFATPFALFLGWASARHVEVWHAAFACFCLYFFTPFIAQRIESLFLAAKAAQDSGHMIYFPATIGLHVVGALALAVWRARTPPPDVATTDGSAGILPACE